MPRSKRASKPGSGEREGHAREIGTVATSVRAPLWIQYAHLAGLGPGRAQPPSAVRAYLTVIDRFPETVEEALLGAARISPMAGCCRRSG